MSCFVGINATKFLWKDLFKVPPLFAQPTTMI